MQSIRFLRKNTIYPILILEGGVLFSPHPPGRGNDAHGSKGTKDLTVLSCRVEHVVSWTSGGEIFSSNCFESTKPLSYTDQVPVNKQLSSKTW